METCSAAGTEKHRRDAKVSEACIFWLSYPFVDRLNKEGILKALTELAAELEAANQICELFVVGGAALVLLYGARESTKDVDAFASVPTMNPMLREAAARVAATQGLPHDWLNDAAKGFVHGLSPGPLLLDLPYLQVRALAPHHLLAMKLSAWRDDVDIEDARMLMNHLVGTKQEIWEKVEPHIVPGREMKAQYAFDDLWEAQHGAS